MRLIVTILGILFLSVGVFGQAFDEDEPAPEKKSAPKSVIQEKKVEINTPAESPKPAEAPKPAEPVKTQEAAKPAEPVKTQEAAKPAEPVKTQEAVKPAEPVKTQEAVKPAEPAKIPEAAKPAEQAQPSAPAKTAPAAVTAAKPDETKKVAAPAVLAETVSTILTETVCAVTGTKVKVTDKTPSTDYHGVRYYFVDEARKKEFDKDQWKFTRDIVTCQVCGKQDKVRGRGRNTFPDSRYEGRNYFFCSNAHKSLFEANPLQYIDPDKMFLRTVLKKQKDEPKKPAVKAGPAPSADTTKEK